MKTYTKNNISKALPYTIKVKNRSRRPREVVLFSAEKYIESPDVKNLKWWKRLKLYFSSSAKWLGDGSLLQQRGVIIRSNIDNVSYQDILYQVIRNPFTVGAVNVSISKMTTDFCFKMSMESRDEYTAIQTPMYLYRDRSYNQFTSIFSDFFDRRMAGTTKIMLTVPAKAEVTLFFYPK